MVAREATIFKGIESFMPERHWWQKGEPNWVCVWHEAHDTRKRNPARIYASLMRKHGKLTFSWLVVGTDAHFNNYWVGLRKTDSTWKVLTFGRIKPEVDSWWTGGELPIPTNITSDREKPVEKY
jgi:hypothetical protein